MQNVDSVSYKLTLRKYNLALATSSVSEIEGLILNYGKVLTGKENKILNSRLGGLSLEDVGNMLGVSRERVRDVENKALGKLKGYSTVGSKTYTREDLLRMAIPEFVKTIPPKDSLHIKMRNSLVRNFGDRDLSYLIENPSEIATRKNLGVKSYKALGDFLKGYGISLPEADSFKFDNW